MNSITIKSVNNELVKETAKLQQRKFRDESGLFLLEGDKCVEEAINSGIKIKYLFVLEGSKSYSAENIIITTEAVLSKISSTASSPRVVGVGYQIKQNWSDSFKKVILLEDIKDAGNLGTIIRTSCAFNVDAIILYGDTVDLYNPKCVRATVGNLWKVPVFNIKKFEELKKYTNLFTPIGTLPKSDNTTWLKDYKFPKKALIMFGTESSGLSDELKNYAKDNITIKMSKKVESLNLSVSVSVILYEMNN